LQKPLKLQYTVMHFRLTDLCRTLYFGHDVCDVLPHLTAHLKRRCFIVIAMKRKERQFAHYSHVVISHSTENDIKYSVFLLELFFIIIIIYF
jgi:hypothetical protein